MKYFWRNGPLVLLTIFVTLYGTYFSLFTIERYQKMYAHYFDLGIMHQTVYNTYKGIQTGDFSRVLELTNPHQQPNQIKRMAIHNDILLAFLAPFYFIHDGPETLLVIQSVVLSAGAIFVFFIAREVLQKLPYNNWIALSFATSYLLYYPLQKANKFDFHAVTLATTLLLAMFYAFLRKRYKWSLVFAILSIFAKEQVGLTVAFFGGFILINEYKKRYKQLFSLTNLREYKKELIRLYKKDFNIKFALNIIMISIIWVMVSMFIVIPYFSSTGHFASHYFEYLKEDPMLALYALSQIERIRYLWEVISPVGLFSLFSPLHLFIALPELLINLLSSNDSMRNTYFHYTSVITPFIYISAIYGFNAVFNFITKKWKVREADIVVIITIFLLMTSFKSAFKYGPLPYSKKADMFPWHAARPKVEDAIYWKSKLEDDSLKVAATGQLAPFFTSRRYFYDFNYTYPNADYIVIDRYDVQYGFMSKYSRPAYLDLLNDPRYIRIYDRNEIEVYRKI